MSLVYDNFAGGLDDLHGISCGAALFGAGYVPTAADTTIGSITGELTGGSYARQTFVAAWDATALRLKVRDADHWPTYDAASTTPNITQVVYYRASDGKLISVVDYTSQAGVDGWTLQPVNGFAGVEAPGLINDRLDALEATTVAGVAPVSGDYPLAALIAAGLGGGSGGGTSMLYAIQVASGTVVDGTATDVDLITANGPYSVPIATLTGIISDYADLGVTAYVGGDGGDGTCVGLFTIPGDTDPWEPYTPTADAEVRFLTSERQGLLTNADGPLTLPDPTAPATKVDTHSIVANRVQVFDDPAASPSNYTPDGGGLTLDAHLIGIDAALAGGGGGGVTLSGNTPLGLGPADAGTGTQAARDDHVHGLPSPLTLGAADATTTVNGHPLSSNVTVSASDITTGTLPIAQVPTGTTGSTVPLGNDSRFSDARTPTAHATSHKTGGSDAIALHELAVPTGAVALNAQKITGLANGSSAQDAAAFGQIPTASSSTPIVAGTGAAGSSSNWAKGDHVHPYSPQVIGGQDEGTTQTTSSDTSLLDATISLSGLAAGDLVRVDAGLRFLNNSGSGRTHTLKLKLGSTTVATLTTASMATSASSRDGMFTAVIRVEAAADQNTTAKAEISAFSTTIVNAATTENLSTGVALDLTGAVGAGGSQEIQVMHLTVARVRA